MKVEDLRFQPGDDILVIKGTYKGRYGTVEEYEPIFEVYMVQLPELSPGGTFGVLEHEMDFMPDEEEEEYEDLEEEEDMVPVAEFGMTEDEYASHLEFMVTRVLEGVPSTGPEQAFFGFQDWEGLEPKEIYASILERIEDGMRLFVQLHVLTARVAYALDKMQETLDD